MKRGLSGGFRCSMSGCAENTRLKHNLSFFRFPLDPERSKLWLQGCGIQKDITPKKLYSNYRVCSKHFASNMFVNHLKNRLQQNAVPSSVPNVPSKTITLINIEETSAEKCTPLNIEPSVSNAVASCSTSNLTVVEVDDRNLIENPTIIYYDNTVKHDKSTQTESKLSDSNPRKVALLKKLRAAERREKRAKLACEMRKMKEKNISLNDFKKLMYKFFPKPIADFMQTQMYNFDSRGNRYTQEMKKFCLDLYRKGPNAYRFLGTVFTLPKRRTLERLIERQRYQMLDR